MGIIAVILVLASGGLHSIWNFLVKRSEDKLCFLWGAKVISVLLLSPLFSLYITFDVRIFRGDGGNLAYLLALGFISGTVHLLYNYFLSQAYRFGDISLSYPIARGAAPFLVVLVAFFFLGEVPSVLGLLGMLMVALGIVSMVITRSSGNPRKYEEKNSDPSSGLFGFQSPVLFAAITAIMISGYVFIDGRGSRVFGPLVFMYVFSLISTTLLTIPMMGKKNAVYRELKNNMGAVIGTGILMPLSYFLALQAMRLSPLAYVASLRNISIVFAAFLGVVVLLEPFTLTRFLGSIVIFGGALLLGMS